MKETVRFVSEYRGELQYNKFPWNPSQKLLQSLTLITTKRKQLQVIEAELNKLNMERDTKDILMAEIEYQLLTPSTYLEVSKI